MTIGLLPQEGAWHGNGNGEKGARGAQEPGAFLDEWSRLYDEMRQAFERQSAQQDLLVRSFVKRMELQKLTASPREPVEPPMAEDEKMAHLAKELHIGHEGSHSAETRCSGATCATSQDSLRAENYALSVLPEARKSNSGVLNLDASAESYDSEITHESKDTPKSRRGHDDCNNSSRMSPSSKRSEIRKKTSERALERARRPSADAQASSVENSMDTSSEASQRLPAGDGHTPRGRQMKKSKARKLVTDKRSVKAQSVAWEKNGPLSKFLSWWTNLQEPPREGRLHDLTQHPFFDVACNLVIMATCVYTIVLTNRAVTNHDPVSLPVDIFGFCLSGFYTLEIALKIWVHRWYFFCSEDMGWNIFDFCLVISEIQGTIMRLLESGMKVSFLRSLRILKMARVLRLLRLIYIFRELRLLLDAMIGSLITVLWCGMVILFCLTISAMMFVQFVADFMKEDYLDPAGLVTAPVRQGILDNFGSVQQAALSLFMAMSGGENWNVYYDQMLAIGWGPAAALILFTFWFQFGMFNLLTSIFVDRAMKASTPDIDIMILEQRQKESDQVAALKRQCSKFDEDGSGTVSAEEFEEMILDPVMSSFLAAAGLEISDAEMFFSLLSETTGSTVPIDTFVEGCMRMKGTATAIDMQVMRCEMQVISDKVDKTMKACLGQNAALGQAAGRKASKPTPPVRALEEDNNKVLL